MGRNAWRTPKNLGGYPLWAFISMFYNITQANWTVPQLIPRDRQCSSDQKWSPKMNRKWSSLSTANDPERKIREWPGLKLVVHRVTFIIATKRINSTELIQQINAKTEKERNLEHYTNKCKQKENLNATSKTIALLNYWLTLKLNWTKPHIL